MKVLMVGVDRTSVGGMLTVVENYLNDDKFCDATKLVYIPSVVNSSVVRKILFFIIALVKIIFCILVSRIDLVHIHMAERTSVYREGLIARFAKLLGCKVIIHMHGANIETWYNHKTKRGKKIASYFIDAADKVIVLGYNWVPFMETIVSNKNKVVVVYNSVPAIPYNSYSNKSHDIIFLGMLIQRKGIEDLLLAFANILPKIPENICLKLYGDDKNKNIKELISQNNLEKRAFFCGWLTNDKKSDVFKKTLLNILPSYNEGLPMTILETMSYGIPNISTEIAAIPELIENGKNGILIEPGNVAALENAMLFLLNDSAKLQEFSENAYHTIKGKFTVEKHLKTIFSLYESLLYGK